MFPGPLLASSQTGAGKGWQHPQMLSMLALTTWLHPRLTSKNRLFVRACTAVVVLTCGFEAAAVVDCAGGSLLGSSGSVAERLHNDQLTTPLTPGEAAASVPACT